MITDLKTETMKHTGASNFFAFHPIFPCFKGNFIKKIFKLCPPDIGDTCTSKTNV